MASSRLFMQRLWDWGDSSLIVVFTARKAGTGRTPGSLVELFVHHLSNRGLQCHSIRVFHQAAQPICNLVCPACACAVTVERFSNIP